MADQAQLQAHRAAIANSRTMVEYYSDSPGKAAQNAALEAAGLAPLHSKASLSWDIKQREEHLQRAEALESLLADLTPAQEQAA